ncbi:unnamed protein product [Adineta steineri]|uniref:Tetratricopeptide repeat protein n=1 Tax=Adineta steineri TaxID=433720 RepID=A0A816BEA9_9BILA|nr:unnamed protein product [Adineta steineri]CAF1607135.1 unnamed protein product [Adineta steineri]
MTEKKSATVNNSITQSKPIAVKQEAPILIWYNKNNDEKKSRSSSATDILSRTHSLKQIDTIFIHCQSSREQQRCQYLLEHYSKIFDLFLDRQLLLDTIQENVILYQHQSGNEYLRSAERYKQQNQLNHALKYTHKALDIYRKTLPNQNHPLIARCLNNLGTIYDAQGDVNRSFEYYEQAVKMYRNISPALSKQSVPNLLKK